MIFKDITAGAVHQIYRIAEFEGIAADQLYVKIDDRPVGPWKMFWSVMLTDSFDPDHYYLEELGGLRLAIWKPSAVFLVGATIDFDPNLVEKPFYNGVASPVDPDRPVIPKGFVFLNQAIYPQSQFV